MGTITLKVPQDIHLEYQIDNTKMVVQLLEWLQPLQKQPIEDKSLAESPNRANSVPIFAKPLIVPQENLKGKDSSIPSTKAVYQWELKAQENLTRYEKTGMLPEGMFDFD
jgi:hypothetical protein